MKDIVIYGAGSCANSIIWNLKDKYNIKYFVDTSDLKQGTKYIDSDGKEYDIYHPSKLKDLDFNEIYIPIMIPNRRQEIINTIHSILGNDYQKINVLFTDVSLYSRYNFIYELNYLFKKKNIDGVCAELGVYRGDTSAVINSAFKDDKLYLLDTFEGFNEKDLEIENKEKFSKVRANYELSDTSIDIVKDKLPYPDNCEFIKGYFPETASCLPDDTKYKFVNIDVDLYKPILDGLEYFYPRMVRGGVILVHDYFNSSFIGATKAVDEFALKYKLDFMPVGDGMSVYFIKN